MITFNASLQHELQALEDLRASCNGPKAVFSPVCRRLRRQRLHRLAATDSIEDLGSHSMMDTSADLLRKLHDAGRQAASDWLARDELEQAA